MAKQENGSGTGRYTGYDIGSDSIPVSKPWFWKILLISLLITAVIITTVCFVLFHRKTEETKSLQEINDANTLKNLMKGHENIKITKSYSHLVDAKDFTTTRQVSLGEGGDYYSYYKVEGSAADFKEVIDHGEYYRNENDFSYYYGLIGDDYQKLCVEPIENEVFQLNTDDTLGDQNSSGKLMTIKLTYTVQSGDDYNTNYGFEAGTEIQKKVTCEKDTKLITSIAESVEDEVFFSYLVEYDTKLKVPNFYQRIRNAKTTRTCTVVSSYNGENEKNYSYTFASGTYFSMFEHEGYAMYQDKEGNVEYTISNVQLQNPNGDLTLYVMPAKAKE